ncbi:complement factor I isoform X1 [Anolis carolinensis]|uniref:complement factor I isoform X1 n=1 Tax=Anolis carolinensis TaxID=28377 RepID=UPI002F2B7B47
MKPVSVLAFSLCLSLCILGQKQEAYLIEECVSKSYSQNSCEKVFCQPWQKCVHGSCICKIPYQCPKNGTVVCTANRKTFRTYCQLKSYECKHEMSKFLHRGNCNLQGTFQIFFGPNSTSSEGTLQVEMTPHQKMFICGSGWGMNEANVACRHLGFPIGADLTELVDPDAASHPSECLKATCRGIETSLAECTLSRQNWNSQKLAKVVCHTQPKDCSSGEFRCVNGKCMPSDKACDGINDCGDLSDELCCNACRGESFHCKSDVCIPNKYLCNNEMDCLTGEDESQQLCANRGGENQREEGEVEESMDEERKKTKMYLPQLHCGIAKHTQSRQKRIAGGITAQKDEFPWHMSIINEYGRMHCGAVYIGGCWALTAANCIGPEYLAYRIWSGLLNSVRGNEGIDSHFLKRVIFHEKYNFQTRENNIALLEMGRCRLSNSIPACIPWSQYMFKSGHQCKVSGLGSVEYMRKQYQLRWGYVYLMENCSEIYRENFLNGMECAGTADGSVDTCTNDAGGPLVCFDTNNVGYVWGIASSQNCGAQGNPGIYTKVANYFDWIGYHTGLSLVSRYNV